MNNSKNIEESGSSINWGKVSALAAVAAVIVAIVGLLKTDPLSPVDEYIYLSNVPYKLVDGFEPIGRFKFDKPYFFNRIQINGKKFKFGPVMHPDKDRPARIAFNISSLQRFKFFEATIGINDESAKCDPAGGSIGSVVFIVSVDGTELDRWHIIRGPGSPVKIEIPSGSELVLEANDAGDGNRCDGAVWANSKLTI